MIVLNNYRIEIKWGLIFAGVTLLWMLLERLLGLHSTNIDKHVIVTNFFMIPAIAVYVYALLNKKKYFYNGIITYKQSFVSGLIVTIVVTLLSPVTQLITIYVITPDFFNNMIKYAVESGHSNQAEAEAYFNTGNYVLETVIFTPVMGILTSAIISIFIKSKKNA